MQSQEACHKENRTILRVIDALDPRPGRGRGECPVYIYFLCDQEDGRPRYVGQTVCPYDRLVEHWRGYASIDTSRWIASLKAEGRRLRMCVVDIVTASEAAVAEKRWAERFWDEGEAILNRLMLTPKRREDWLRRRRGRDE